MTNINLDLFSTEERALAETIDSTRMPQHVAIIMDGKWPLGFAARFAARHRSSRPG